MLPRTGTISMPLASGPGWGRFCWARAMVARAAILAHARRASIRRWLIFFKRCSCCLLWLRLFLGRVYFLVAVAGPFLAAALFVSAIILRANSGYMVAAPPW